VTYTKNVNAGTAVVKIQGKNNYIGKESEIRFTINKASISGWNNYNNMSAQEGITNGAYYVGGEVPFTSVTLNRTGGGPGGGAATPLTITSDDAIIIARTFSGNGQQLTAVTIKENPKGNYTFADKNVNLHTAVYSDSLNLNDAVVTGTVEAGYPRASYTNNFVKEHITVTVNGKEIAKSAYNVGSATLDPSTATVGTPETKVTFTITPVNNAHMIGSKNAEAAVVAYDIEQYIKDGAGRTPTIDKEYAYTGKAAEPKYTISGLVADTDFTVTYEGDNVNAGTATAVISGKGNYSGSVKQDFTIEKATISSADLSFTTEEPDVEYSAAGVEDKSASLEVKVKDTDTTAYQFVKGSDYELSLANKNVDQGQSVVYNVAIKESGNYKPVAGLTVSGYKVFAKQVKNPTVTLDTTVFKVDEPKVYTATVVVDDVELTKDTDYTLTELEDWTKLTSETNPTYLKVTFIGNYAGTYNVPVSIVENYDYELDLEKVKLTEPRKSYLVFSNSAKRPIVSYIGDTAVFDQITNKYNNDFYTVKYFDAEGTELPGAPKDVGTYTAKVVATTAYGGKTYDELTYEITQKKLTKDQFKTLLSGVSIGSVYGDRTGLIDNDTVMYFGWMTTPVVCEGNAPSTDFEFAKPVDTNWDGVATEGTAVVQLKEDANYSYKGTGNVTFGWEKGDLSFIDEDDFYFIPDQPYTGAKVEPTTVEAWAEGNHMSADWVTLNYWENNDLKTAHAWASGYVVAPADDLFYTNGQSVWFEFAITTPAAIEEAADEALEAAAGIDSTYPADAQKAVEDAAADLKDLIDGMGTTNQVATATAKLNKAILNAEIAKANATIAEADKYTSAVYTDASVSAIAAAKKAVKDAIATGDAAKIKEANAKLEAAVKAAVKKVANGMTVSKKTKKVKASSLKKKSKKVTAITVANATGKVTYSGKGVNKKSKKALKVLSNGKIKVKKGTKKGTYKIKVTVKAAGDGNTLAATKTVKVKIKVK
jgi:hypothetical protein